ncbi:alpha-ketoglutarate-dependent dioxygenase AlkB family protein [Rubellimicrobium arenae]|uniref:alpha-ketoglutarate-dependent dioxygenase AlkB family protein n=1 Tax=Rubellimicrobium arenae TaxID=2817372 RepID=UPI001B3171F2|nr:alpha-ketoglutarate-dependent dioxygenase AlkB [Rubellimicrobium arenae]
MAQPLELNGVVVWPGLLDRSEQEAVLSDILEVMAVAPPVHPVTRWGKSMSVAMTAAGRFGWISDRRGYRYEEHHPQGMAWPPIPASVLAVWEAVAPGARTPECCLVNLYRNGARMGLHQDRDEADLSQPVVSISLGDEALFRVGGLQRGGPTGSIWLRSGDVAVIGGAARLVHHGIDRVREGSSDLIPGGGRINLTLRVVTSADGGAAP